MTSASYPTHRLALQLTERKQTKPLTLATAEVPNLAAGEVLVENVAVAQNPVDYKRVDMDRITAFPATPGGDLSGRVIAVSDDVKTLKVGDRVASFLSQVDPKEGAYQQYTIAKAVQTFKIPDHVSHESASTLPLAFATAVGGIHGFLQIPIPAPGVSLPLPLNNLPPVLVWGGSSSVGAYAIQLARLSGYRVVATCSPRNFDYVKSLGADIVLNYQDVDQAIEEIKAASGGNLSLVLDAISENGSTEAAVKCLGPNGGVIALVLAVDESVKNGRSDVVMQVSGARLLVEKPELLDSFRFLTEALESKKFIPNRVSGVKLVYVVADTPGLA
ncbi:GroES-like protein [Pseudohyphozyma bogoriensis]|nr:GroES-like protein [Pseudohyphozyma bogoriensis]